VCRPEKGHASTCACRASQVSGEESLGDRSLRSRHTKGSMFGKEHDEDGASRVSRKERLRASNAAQFPRAGNVRDRADLFHERFANRCISNSEIPRLGTYLTPAISIAKAFLIAKLCDFRASAFSVSATAASAISNRRKSAVFAFLQDSSSLATRRRSCYSESSNLPQHLTTLSKQTERLAPGFRFAPRLRRRNLHGYRSDAQDI